MNSGKRSLEDEHDIVTKVFPSISLFIPCYFYRFYGGRCLDRVKGL